MSLGTIMSHVVNLGSKRSIVIELMLPPVLLDIIELKIYPNELLLGQYSAIGIKEA